MPSPEVSIILPVYNTARYLRVAIDSILQQSFSDFELIIINDGSTDDSRNVIRSYTDSRIRYVENETNSGLVHSLNKGIELSRAALIARMDGDDIAMSTRLAKQVRWMNAHPETDLLATRVSLIDGEDQPLPNWKDDEEAITPEQILAYLPINNCIAHPSVMARTRLMKEYRYRYSQRLAEDYDLWLRMGADGKRMEKLDEPLLKHRILSSSFTRTRQKNPFYKIMRVKFRFVKECRQEGKWNAFISKTFRFAMLDAAKGLGKQIKSYSK